MRGHAPNIRYSNNPNHGDSHSSAVTRALTSPPAGNSDFTSDVTSDPVAAPATLLSVRCFLLGLVPPTRAMVRGAGCGVAVTKGMVTKGMLGGGCGAEPSREDGGDIGAGCGIGAVGAAVCVLFGVGCGIGAVGAAVCVLFGVRGGIGAVGAAVCVLFGVCSGIGAP